MPIKPYGEGQGNGIEAYTPSTPYYYESDNVPLKNLANNDLIISTQVDSMVPKYPVETPDGTIKTFTFPDGEKAVAGSLEVYINGVQYNPLNITLSNDGTQFTINENDIIPDGGDDFYVMYRMLNELNVISEVIPFESSNLYIGDLANTNLIKASIIISFAGTNLIRDDASGNLILISDSSFVGTIDYARGIYDFAYDFLPSGFPFESGDEIVISYQNYIQ